MKRRVAEASGALLISVAALHACNGKLSLDNDHKPPLQLAMSVHDYSIDGERFSDTTVFKYNERNQLVYCYEQGFDGIRGLDSVQYDNQGRVAAFVHFVDGEPVFGLQTKAKVTYVSADMVVISTASCPLNKTGAAKEEVDTAMVYQADTLMLKKGRVMQKTGNAAYSYLYNDAGEYLDEAYVADTAYLNPIALAGNQQFWTIVMDMPIWGNRYYTRFKEMTGTLLPFVSYEKKTGARYPEMEQWQTGGIKETVRYFYTE